MNHTRKEQVPSHEDYLKTAEELCPNIDYAVILGQAACLLSEAANRFSSNPDKSKYIKTSLKLKELSSALAKELNIKINLPKQWKVLKESR